MVKEKSVDERILSRLDSLLALQLRREESMKSTVDKAVFLKKNGFENQEIANLLDTSAGTVAVLLSRKKGGKEKTNGRTA